jgi:hypothetical protein
MSHQPRTPETGGAWGCSPVQVACRGGYYNQHKYGGRGEPLQLPVRQFEFKEISREEHLHTMSDGTVVSKTATTVVVEEGSEVKKIVPTIFLTKLFTNFDLKNLVWIQIESRFR